MTNALKLARTTRLMVTILGLVLGSGSPCMAVERAKYSVVKADPPYEIRDYVSSVTAVVDVNGTRSDAVNTGFRVLAKYIFGDNRQQLKIAMTAPVTQMPQASRPLSASAPDVQSPDSWTVSFMMPSGYALKSLPAPSDNRVHFAQSPAHRAAAIRFSGFWTDANLNAHQAQLLQWMQSQHLTPASVPTFAYYDPPWTPWFMRTIEVLIDIAPTP